METILVTGASGFVGSRFVKRWAAEYNILAPSHAELDITDDASVESYFQQHHPSVVVHLAAISNTGYCEEHPDESYAVNAIAAQRMAKAAALSYAKFVFFSSDQVYNGNLQYGLLSESMDVAPETVYAQHKLLAEQLVTQAHPNAVILRATWMYDSDKDKTMPLHPNFIVNINKAIEEHMQSMVGEEKASTLSSENEIVKPKPIAFSVREFRGITWVREVVEFMPATFTLKAGVYNFGAENRLNTYETACCYFEMMELPLKCDSVIVADADRYPNHERNISMSNSKISDASNGAIFFSTTIDGLRIFIENNKSDRY